VPAGDFASLDTETGIPIVSTVFRPNPAFGQVVEGSFVACDGQTACIPGGKSFRFRMNDADFGRLLARARLLDAALSEDPASYFIAQFRVHNETFGEAELGATIGWLQMDVWY
jgi:hypothetical protein